MVHAKFVSPQKLGNIKVEIRGKYEGTQLKNTLMKNKLDTEQRKKNAKKVRQNVTFLVTKEVSVVTK